MGVCVLYYGGISKLTFAPGVGPVEVEFLDGGTSNPAVRSFPRPLTAKLVHARIGGRDVGNPQRVVPQVASDWWPSAQGNSWRYSYQGPTGYQTFSVEAGSPSGGWSRIRGRNGNTWIWVSTRTGKIYVWDSANRKVREVVDLAPTASARQNADKLENFAGLLVDQDAARVCHDDTTFTITDRNASVQTAAGSFTNCIRLTITNACMYGGLSAITFAPGVGPVQFHFLDNYSTSRAAYPMPVVAELDYASVNGKAYGTP